MLSSHHNAPDGRPLIEVTETNVTPSGSLVLGGTACVFEGNVLIYVVPRNGDEHFKFSQASAGGPERGTWSATIESHDMPARLFISDEDASNDEAGGPALSQQSMIVLHVGTRGEVTTE